jgi:hypothetical protein
MFQFLVGETMNQEEFQKVVEGTIEEIKQTLIIKGKEYTTNKDRLKNFKDAGRFMDLEPEVALLGFVAKHIIALKDFIWQLNGFEGDDSKTVTREQWLEKSGDIISYMILLRGLLKERNIL